MFASRIEKISASGIRKVFDLAAKMEDPVNFSIGQPHFDVPEPIKQTAIQAIQEGQNAYTVTQGIEPLRQALLDHIEKTRGRRPKNVLVTGGVSGAILLALMVLVEPGEEVIIPDPYFVMYKSLVHLVGGVPKFYDMYPDFRLDTEKIKNLITDKTKVILLNSPSNPTGCLSDEASLKELANVLQERNIIVITDEIYSSFVYDEPYYSIFPHYSNTILLDGFSKAYGMTGWRMGYAAGPEQIIDKMTTLQQFSFVCAPSIAQHACVTALKTDMESYRLEYKKKRDMIYEGLRDNGYEVVKPGGSFYIFPKVPWGTGKEFCEAAVKENMLIIPGGAFSERDTHIRISFAVSEEKLQQGIDILARLAKK